MKMLSALLAVLLLTGVANAAPTNVVTPPSCYSDIENLPIFKVEVTHATDLGNGVVKWSPSRGSIFLAEKNFWITAAHVMNDGQTKKGLIRVNEGTYIEAELVYFNKEKDVAVLYGDSGDMKPLNLMSSPIDQFEAVWSVGYPGLAGNTIVSFEGSALNISNNGSVITNAMVLPGMSGGPLFRCKGGEVLETVSTISSYSVEQSGYTERVAEDGTKTIIIVNANTGGSYSTPRLAAHLSKAMEQRIADLDARQAELKELIDATKKEIQ